MTRLKSRIGSFIVTIAMLAFVLPTSIVSAETSQAKTLSEALLKTNSAKSIESDGKLSVKLEAEGLAKNDQQQYTEISKFLNNLQVTFNAKQSQKSNGKVSRQYVKTTANVSGISFNGEIWNEKNLKGKKTEVKTIVKSPQLFKMILPSQYTNKYMVLDSKQNKEMPKMQGNLNSKHFGKIISENKELQKLVLTIAEKYSSELNLKSNSITNDGNVYKVKIDDATFKSIIRKVVNLTAKNSEVQNLIKDYTITQMKNSGASNKEINSAKIQMEYMFNKLKSQKFLDEFNQNMDKLNDIKILGDKGIEINYTIDKSGYITSTKGHIELFADLSKLEKAFGKNPNDNMHKGTATANIDFEVNNKNINKKINITLPKLTSKNSFHWNLCEKPQPIKVPCEVKKNPKDIRTFDKVKCIKVRDIIGGDNTKYTYSKGNATIIANGKTLTLTKGEKNVKVDGKIVNLKSENGYIYKDRLYVPLEVCNLINVNIK